MAEQISNGRGTQYPKFSKVTDILGITDLNENIVDFSKRIDKSDNKNAKALIAGIIRALKALSLSDDITFSQLLYCDSYKCAIIYFKMLDDVLEVNDIFFKMYKPLTDAQNLYGGEVFNQYDSIYYPEVVGPDRQ